MGAAAVMQSLLAQLAAAAKIVQLQSTCNQPA
jgi:hypothetical protein